LFLFLINSVFVPWQEAVTLCTVSIVLALWSR